MHKRGDQWTIAKKTKMQFLVFTGVLNTGNEGFEAPLETVHEAGNPRIWVLVIEGSRSKWKEKQSDDGTGDRTELAWVGKDNKGVEMVPMIVHMERYVISKEWKKRWGCKRHACNVQDDLSVTPLMQMFF